MAMTMPKILDCSASDCSYNQSKKCHALAITVGDSECPFCDTFFKTAKKGGSMDVIAGVGACKESDCKFNSSLECSASGIHVGLHEGHAECTTYAKK